MIRKLRISRVCLAAACLWSASVITAHAQSDSTKSTYGSGGSLLRGGVMGELMAVSVPRSETELQKLLEEAHDLERLADSEIKSNTDLITEAEGRARIMQEEMKVTKARHDAAKKAKDKAAATELDATYKQQQRQYKYLTQLHDARQADTDRLRAARSAAEATAKALDLELQLSRKQEQLGENPPAQATDEYRSLLHKMLDAQGDAADQTKESSMKRKKLVEQRLKQLNALGKL